MSLISRYIVREVAGLWLVVIAVLFVIFMSNQLAEILGEAATDELPRDAVLAVFGLTTLNYLTVLTPLALFLGVILAFARLNRDSEMAALFACGVGPVRLLRPVALLAIVLAAVVGWLALDTTPEASRRIEQIRYEARESVRLDVLEAGRFTSPDSGDTVVYAREVAGDEIHDVFVQTSAEDRVVAIVAARGERTVDPATGRTTFVLYDGRRYEGVPGEKNFLVIGFGEHGIPVRTQAKEEYVEDVAARPTSELIGSSDPAERAELQWRLSSPISLLVLALLAVALGSRSSPREGRYARVGVALLLYMIYVNLLSMARVWMERQLGPDWLGLWWVHGLAFLIAVWLLGRDAGWFVRTGHGGEAATA
ncbi:MAG TPA: LPS export ABC transporter permease LptF [Gammaproteobacteria bacterium]